MSSITFLTSDAGLVVRADIEDTPDGPVLHLQGVNCRLDGEAPDMYHLVLVDEGAKK